MEGAVIVLKVARFGKSLGVILPQEVASARLHVAAGDTLYLVEAADGYRVMSQMTVATDVMARRRGALRELAKR